MVSFSSTAFVRFDFLASFNSTTIQANILAAAYQATGTATGRALNLAVSSLFVPSAGYRGIKTVVIVVTDGMSQEQSSFVAAAALNIQQYAEVFAVCVMLIALS